MMSYLSGWGRNKKFKGNCLSPTSINELREIVSTHKGKLIARGNGRAYGDAGISQGLTISMLNLNLIEEFNSKSGELIAQSGLLIDQVIKNYMSKGWFPFVVSGTKFITLGGAIAGDIHGKNHHKAGSFGDHVNWIELMDFNGKLIKCSKNSNAELFNWTLGGHGLTGIVTKCSISLKKISSSWISAETIINNNLQETLDSFEKYDEKEYSVAWLDSSATSKNTGRSILFVGEFAKPFQLEKKSLFKNSPMRFIKIYDFFPSFIINYRSFKALNFLYFYFHKIFKKKKLKPLDSFFFPLDNIDNWNKVYGSKGFFQIQFVMDEEKFKKALPKVLDLLKEHHSCSFVSVLKKFKSFRKDSLSFPKPGFTLSLDFKSDQRNQQLAQEIIQMISEHNGSFYLAKDSNLTPEIFLNTQSNLKEFISFLKQSDSINHFSSELSNRLKIS